MELQPILHVWINHDSDLVNKVHETDEQIHTTEKHPFFTEEAGFVPVSDPNVGMHILEANGQYGVLTGWIVVPGNATMYNLEVNQDHTYTVGDGQ